MVGGSIPSLPTNTENGDVLNGHVAQVVERQIHILHVEGSNPSMTSIQPSPKLGDTKEEVERTYEMTRETMHRQCLLRHETGAMQTSWIEAEFAVKGRPLRLKEDGGWQEGWRVEEAYVGELPSKVVQERERDFKSHRRATDV